MRATRARRALGPYRPRAPEGRRPKGAARVPGPGHLLPPLPTTSSFFSGSTFRRYTGDRPQVCLVLCCCLLSFQPRAFEPLYKYRLVGQIPPITPCFADVHRFGRLALLCDDKARYFPAGLPHQAGGVRIPIHLSCRATRRECTGVTSVHQVCHFNLTFGLSGSARHHRMFIANDFLIAGEEDLCLPSKVMDFEAKHKERALGQPGPFICL